jgi:pimeloyl-ACP methyl ester carboxylesterase
MMTSKPLSTDRVQAVPADREELTVHGSRTRYWGYGPREAKTTIVAVHGYRGEHHGLEPIVARLPEVRVLVPDLPGFGESTPMSGTTHDVAGYASWLADFLEATGLTGEAILLGHSFGSIVVAAAAASGVRTPALVLVNPIAVSGLKGPHPLATRVTVAYYRLAAVLPERLGCALLRNRLVVQFMSSTMAKTRDKALRRWIHAEHHTYFSRFANRLVALEAFRASISTDVSAFTRRIAVPTLLVAAAQDDITPLPAQHALQRELGDATLRVIDGVGHLIHYETPGQAARIIAAFLTAHDAR